MHDAQFDIAIHISSANFIEQQLKKNDTKSNVTLRIKRVYFDQILSGEKTIEYRDCKAFYERLFRDVTTLKTLTLHYQRARKLRADIVAITRIKTPDFFKDEGDGIEFGSHTFAIIVRNARLI